MDNRTHTLPTSAPRSAANANFSTELIVSDALVARDLPGLQYLLDTLFELGDISGREAD